MKKIAAVLIGVLASLSFAVPASAAGTCKVGGAAKTPLVAWPNVLLRNTNTTGYTGTPFSYKVKLDQTDIVGGEYYRWRTLDYGYDHSQEFYDIFSGKRGDIVQIQTWCGGKRGADWNGRVRY